MAEGKTGDAEVTRVEGSAQAVFDAITKDTSFNLNDPNSLFRALERAGVEEEAPITKPDYEQLVTMTTQQAEQETEVEQVETAKPVEAKAEVAKPDPELTKQLEALKSERAELAAKLAEATATREKSLSSEARKAIIAKLEEELGADSPIVAAQKLLADQLDRQEAKMAEADKRVAEADARAEKAQAIAEHNVNLKGNLILGELYANNDLAKLAAAKAISDDIVAKNADLPDAEIYKKVEEALKSEYPTLREKHYPKPSGKSRPASVKTVGTLTDIAGGRSPEVSKDGKGLNDLNPHQLSAVSASMPQPDFNSVFRALTR